MFDRFALLLAAAIAACAVPAIAADVKPADVKPAPKTSGGKADQNSVDDQLMKALDADLLDEPADKPATRPAKGEPLPAKTSGKPAEKPTAEKPAGDKVPGGDPAKSKASNVDSPLDQGDDGEDLGMGEEDGLKRIERTMRAAQARIGDFRSDAATQKMQQEVLANLDQLIKQVEQQKSQSPSPSQSKSGAKPNKSQKKSDSGPADSGNTPNDKPAQDSSKDLRQDQAQRPTPEQIKSLTEKTWLQLPPKAREAMIQSSDERFLPKYEISSEKYFKRLNEAEQDHP